MQNINIKLILISTFVVFCANPLVGQEEVFNFNKDEIVVYAPKWEENLQNTSFPIMNMDSTVVAMQNPQTAADLLNFSNNVFIQKSQQGGGSPMIRGFATNRLLYTVDGIRMNSAIFRAGNIQNVISLDPFAIENAEIIFGVAPIIYGSDAIGGVMAFKTLTPQYNNSINNKELITKNNSIFRYSSANQEKTGHFDFTVSNNTFSSLTSVSFNDFRDLKMGKYGPDEYLRNYYSKRINHNDFVINNADELLQHPTSYSQYNIMQKFRYRPVKSLDVQYGFHLSETSDYSRYDRLIRIKNDSVGLPYLPYSEWYYGPQKWMLNNIQIIYSDSNFMYDKLELIVAHQRFEESRNDRSHNEIILHNKTEKVDAYSLNLDFNKSIKNGVVFYGIESIINDVNSSGLDINIDNKLQKLASSRYPNSNWQSYAAYIYTSKRIIDIVTLEAGIRYNHYLLNAIFDTTFYHFPFKTANINNGNFTWSAGTNINLPDDFFVRINTSTGFRAPNVDDMGKIFDSQEGHCTVPNPNLKAEYAYNIDLGISKIFNKIFKIEVNTYYTYLLNAMVRRPFQLNGKDSIMYNSVLSQVDAVQNAANAKVYGIQASIELVVGKRFKLLSNINYQKGEEELDDGSISPLRHSAPMFGTTKLIFNHFRFATQLYVNYAAGVRYENMPEEEKGKPELYAVDINGNPYSPAWYTLNIKISYKINDNLSIFAGLENITDMRYRPYSSGLISPGRNFIISLKTNF